MEYEDGSVTISSMFFQIFSSLHRKLNYSVFQYQPARHRSDHAALGRIADFSSAKEHGMVNWPST